MRCLNEVDLELDPCKNYFYGANGAGKTSLLEAVHLLGRGRSFRSRETRGLVQRGREALSVFGETVSADGCVRIGVGCGGDGLDIRIDGRGGQSALALAELLPVQVLGPDLHGLIEGSPGERRRFLDWGVFHVEQGYLANWRRFRRVLGQRNAMLREGRPGRDLQAWDTVFAEVGSAVDQARQSYAVQLAACIRDVGTRLLGEALELEYRRGWSGEQHLADALQRSAERERRMQTTVVGPHRADFVVRMEAGGVRDRASRGQQKLIAAALLVGQTQLVAGRAGRPGVLLIDDPAAELDESSVRRLLEVLGSIDSQLLFTGLSQQQLPPEPGYPVFHVERGRIAPVL